MTREFSFRDAKNVIEQIKTLTKRLTKASEFQIEKHKEISQVFSSLYSFNYFSDIANDELLKVNTARQNNSFDQLIVAMNQYMVSNDLINHAKNLILQMGRETEKEIVSLSPGANPIAWVFTSGKKKQIAAESYEYLERYLDSYITEDANLTIESIEKLSSITIQNVKSHFVENKKEYEDLIKRIVTSPDTKPMVKAIADTFTNYSSLNEKVAEVKNDSKIGEESVKKAIDYLVADELLKLLKQIPIDEINRDRKGIRIKSLREAGYTNMADVFTANAYNLAAVYGISQDNAYTIKRIADGYARQARSGIKIKLSYDDKNKASTNVVKEIYRFKQKRKFIKRIDEVKAQYDGTVSRSISELKKVGSGRFWAFYNDEDKNQIIHCYDNFASIINGDPGQIIRNSYANYRRLNVDTSSDNAWNDFKTDSIEYYNIIEEICPGILGTDDSVYGLPEELAKEIQDECFFPDGLLCTLRRYQEWGVKYILHQERVLLGDEMGLGKTIQAIASMVSLKNTGATHFVVVCPASVVVNWCREISKHSRLKVMMAHGNAKSSVVKAWIKAGGVIVTTYESTSAFNLDPYFRFSQLVVDEAHYIKNRGAARTTRTIELSKHADRILFMTGTALENKVDEMISLIDVLRPSIAQKISNIAFMSTAPQFREMIAPVYYRRKREDVLTELPDLIESEEWCTLSAEEEKAYEEAILSKNWMASRRVSWNIDDLKKSSKMNRMKEIIEDAKNDDRKVLVFSFFLDTIQKIHDELGNQICLNPINGSIHPNRRQEIIDEFDSAPAGTVLCAQIQSGGTGLNIQAASVVIICEPQLKPSIENQAISRAYRMGQSRNVQVFRLLCDDTIDERILELLKEKQAIFDAFADKSVAAQNVEIDDKSIGNIIEAEIERINKKRANQSSSQEDIKPVEKWEKAKEAYYGNPVSVTSRMNNVSQPYGGYINPKDMEITEWKSDKKLNENENIYPSLIGLAVDYLTRFMVDHDVVKAFDISIKGAMVVGETQIAKTLLANIKGLDDTSIISAIKMVGFDGAYRAGLDAYKPVDEICPDSKTVENVRTMVSRSISFVHHVGPVVKFKYTFEGGYTKVIGSGDGDFMTSDTLWDFKVSKHEPTNHNTFQLLIYYIMGLHSKYSEYKSIKYIGIYNPRINKSYRYSVEKIDTDTIRRVEEEVIGY